MVWPNTGDQLAPLPKKKPGLHSPFAYMADERFGAVFNCYWEGYDLHSINFMHVSRKIWIVIPASHCALGSVIVPGLFAWWWTSTVDGYPERSIGEVIELEFETYRHHQRNIDNKSLRGWLRNMLYSLGQQVMRQDPLYYRLYVLLRPDHQWRLVSYPYYAKYDISGDSTAFTHIDINIPRALQDH
ncbi:hypothetical protein MMC22_010600 [Lobaria immixta]|nr:hypothetical protein [Lobaria immixta]